MLFACILFVLVVAAPAASGKRTSTIRSDLKALIRYTNIEINTFVDTCISSEDFEKVLLNLFPAVDILRLKYHPDIKIRYCRCRGWRDVATILL